MAKVITARYRGVCGLCGHDFYEGSLIQKYGFPWCHVECVSTQCQTDLIEAGTSGHKQSTYRRKMKRRD